MVGSHDIGGRKGFGPVEIEPNEPAFHAEWEGRILGVTLTTMARGLVSVDRWRARQEELHPVVYAQLPYFERWIYAIERNLTLEGVLDEAEIEERMRQLAEHPDEPLPDHQDPEFDRAIEELVEKGGPIVQAAPGPPRFGVGDRVYLREITIDRPGDQHTRLPSYAQGRTGVVERVNVAQALPDAMVAGKELRPEHTYAIRLPAADLWPGAEPNASVCVDAWESYLEPADDAERPR